MNTLRTLTLSAALILVSASLCAADEPQPSEQCENGQLEAGFVAGESNVTTHCLEESEPAMDEIAIPETPEVATESNSEDPFGNG